MKQYNSIRAAWTRVPLHAAVIGCPFCRPPVLQQRVRCVLENGITRGKEVIRLDSRPPALPISGKACSPRKMSFPEVSAERIATTIKEKCAPFKCDLYGEGKHTLHIIPAACDELDAYVKYGKKHPANVCEQQFVGMGHSFMDSNGGIQTVVTRIIPVCSASRAFP